MKKLLFSTLAVFVVASAPALADHHGKMDGSGPIKMDQMHNRMFEKHDANGDGVVTKEEFMTTAEERFNAMDADGNGEVTMEESKGYYESKRESMKEKMEKMKKMKEEKAAE